MTKTNDSIYDPEYVEQLFDEMAPSYEWVNYITSFGLSKRWRHQYVDHINIREGQTVVDLMCGMGECWPAILRRVSGRCEITAIDFSQGMLAHAEKRKNKLNSSKINIKKENILSNSIPDSSADHVLSGFGLKTLSVNQQRFLATEIHRILKPGGTYSLIEVSAPSFIPLRVPYMFYLKRIIPLIGKCFLGSPENYRMLGVYTEQFSNCQEFCEMLRSVGLEAKYNEYFWGCATGVSGIKLVK